MEELTSDFAHVVNTKTLSARKPPKVMREEGDNSEKLNSDLKNGRSARK